MKSIDLCVPDYVSRLRQLLRKLTVPTACVLIMVQGSLGFAEDPFEELRIRVENLERENQELRDRVGRDTQPAGYSAEIPPRPVDDLADPNVVGGGEETDEDRRVGDLVERYLQRHDVSSRSDVVAQETRISAIDRAVTGVLDRLNKKTFPTVQVYGAFQADMGFFSQDANSLQTYNTNNVNPPVPEAPPGAIADGVHFRRARLGAKGAINETVNYTFQMDFGFFGRPTFTDVFVEQTQIPYLGTVRIGQWKQPFSLEVVSSFRYTTFMERSVLFQSFDAFRRTGIGFYDNAEDLSMTWAASVFASGQDQYGNTLDQAQLGNGTFININYGGIGTTERITWLPYWDESTNGEDYLHLGMAHFFNAPPGQRAVFRTIPELFIGQSSNINPPTGANGQGVPGNAIGTPTFVSTGTIPVNDYNVLGTELLWVRGPLSVQSEAMVNFVNQGSSTSTLPGMYAQVGYFLTGEHRPYDRKAGAIDRVIPNCNYGYTKDGCKTGIGAWEVAGRFSYLNLNGGAIQGGTIADYTAGVNWYLNPYVKIVFNYIHSSTNYAGLNPATGVPILPTRTNETDMFAARCQMDF